MPFWFKVGLFRRSELQALDHGLLGLGKVLLVLEVGGGDVHPRSNPRASLRRVSGQFGGGTKAAMAAGQPRASPEVPREDLSGECGASHLRNGSRGVGALSQAVTCLHGHEPPPPPPPPSWPLAAARDWFALIVTRGTVSSVGRDPEGAGLLCCIQSLHHCCSMRL